MVRDMHLNALLLKSERKYANDHDAQDQPQRVRQHLAFR
jgi:hypothetical protein